MNQLKSESERLKTFINFPQWPVKFIAPEEFARAGFFSVRNRDLVQCVFCRGVTGEWVPEDDPFVEHQRHFPRCPFVRNVPVGNVAISQEQAETGTEDSPQSKLNMDICGPFEVLPSDTIGGECVYAAERLLDKLCLNKKLETSQPLSIPDLHIASCSSNTPPFSCAERMEMTSEGGERIAEVSGAFSGQNAGSSYLNGTFETNSENSNNAKEKELEKEVTKLREARRCKICLDKDISIVFLPCCHLVSCTDCATGVNKCVVCRESIKAVVKTYLS